MEEFFSDDEQTSLKYAGKTYSKKIYNQVKGELKIVQSRDIDPEFIFKLVYEFLAICQLQGHLLFQDIFNETVDINTQSAERIKITNDINKRILSNTSVACREYRNLEDIPFSDYHYITFKLSKNLVLYLDITLFGQLKSLFIIHKFTDYDIKISPLIDNVFIFPINEKSFYTETFPNVHMKESVIWCDASVDFRYKQLKGLL